MSEYNNDFLSSGSNVQGIARLSLIIPLISGIALILFGWYTFSNYKDIEFLSWALIILGIMIIAGGLVTFFLIKAFGDLVEPAAHREYYLKEAEKTNEKLAEYNKKCAYYLEKMMEQNNK